MSAPRAACMPAWYGTTMTGCAPRLQQWGAPPEHVEGQVGAVQLRHVVPKGRERDTRDTNRLGLTVDLLLGASCGRRLDSASHDGSHAGLNDLAASATQARRLDHPREAREEENQHEHAEARLLLLIAEGRTRSSKLACAH
jgi:hypothetical protein